MSLDSEGRSQICAGHFVLQIEEELGGMKRGSGVTKRRLLPQRALDMGRPVFDLAGLAIGNGLTDPRSQVCILRLLFALV